MEDEELNGILAWDAEKYKKAYFGERVDSPLLAYQFPLEVSTVICGDEGRHKNGILIFKSEEAINAEVDSLPSEVYLKYKGKTLSKRETYSFFAQNWLFQDKESGEIMGMGIIWFKTIIDDREVYLIEDLFLENKIKCTHPNGEIEYFSGIPFCEKSPMDHLNDSGNYDIDEIIKWPIAFLDNEEAEP